MEADSLDGHVSANDDEFCDDGCNLEAVKLAAKFDKNVASHLNPKPATFSRVKGVENEETTGRPMCIRVFEYIFTIHDTRNEFPFSSLCSDQRRLRCRVTRREREMFIKMNIDERRSAPGMSLAMSFIGGMF